jgi:tetratricopeptide (TPR) repeat protein
MNMRTGFVIVFLASLLVATSAIGQYKLYEGGMKNFKAGEYDKAIELLNDFLSKYAHDKVNDDQVYYALGVSYYKKDDYLSAMKAFDAALQVNHNHPFEGSIHWHLAKCCEHMNQLKEAVLEYTDALNLYKSDARNTSKLLTERSHLYTLLNNAELSKADLTQAVALDPNNTDAKSQLDKMNAVVLASTRQAQTTTKDESTKDKKKTTDKKEAKKENKPVQNSDQNKPSQQVVSTPVTDKPVQPLAGAPGNERPVDKPVQQPATSVPPQVVAPEPKEPTLKEMFADERRYALVIGNSNYPSKIGVLKNPKNDATDIAAELTKAGFQVNLLVDATYGEMRKGIYDLKKILDQSDREKTVALFYYAGHGLQAMSENWLVPVDSKLVIENEDDIRVQCVPVQNMLLNNLQYTNSRMNIVILDACRNNPFPSVSRSLGGQGLQEVSRARGSWIAFATAPGSVASDGNGRNGLYTQELLKAMRLPGLSIEEVFKQVRKNVYNLSGQKQETWDNSNIIGDFYFNLNANK